MSDFAERWYKSFDEGVAMIILFRVFLIATVLFGAVDLFGLNKSEEHRYRPAATELEPKVTERPQTSERVPYKPSEVPTEKPTIEASTLPTGEPIPSTRIGSMSLSFEETVAGVPIIVGVGDVGVGIAKEFERVDKKNGLRARYFIVNSLGGWVKEGVTLGAYIRERGLKVVVPQKGYCFSACVYLLAGGVERVVYPDAWVGVHQSTLDEAAAGTVQGGFLGGQASVALDMAYFEAMGVDVKVVQWALSTPPEEMFYISKDDLKQTQLATIVSDNIRLK